MITTILASSTVWRSTFFLCLVVSRGLLFFECYINRLAFSSSSSRGSEDCGKVRVTFVIRESIVYLLKLGLAAQRLFKKYPTVVGLFLSKQYIQ